MTSRNVRHILQWEDDEYLGIDGSALASVRHVPNRPNQVNMYWRIVSEYGAKNQHTLFANGAEMSRPASVYDAKRLAQAIEDLVSGDLKTFPTSPSPDCIRCREAYVESLAPDDFIGRVVTTMIVCQLCGNKRCPMATDHRLLCTASNDSGQQGSLY